METFKYHWPELYEPRQATVLPTWAELIQRNLSTMKYHMRMMAQSESELAKQYHMEEAQTRIRLHNDYVKHNRKQREMTV